MYLEFQRFTFLFPNTQKSVLPDSPLIEKKKKKIHRAAPAVNYNRKKKKNFFSGRIFPPSTHNQSLLRFSFFEYRSLGKCFSLDMLFLRGIRDKGGGYILVQLVQTGSGLCHGLMVKCCKFEAVICNRDFLINDVQC